MAADLAILLRLIDQATPELDRATRGVQRHLDTFSRDATRAGAAFSGALTLPIVGAGVAATKMAADFDSSMNKIVSLVGVSREQVNAWKADLMDISRATDVGPRELADALFFITSAGLEGATAISALTAAAKAADIGLGETKVVADALTSAMNAYGHDTLSAEQATAILINTVKAGKLEPAELALALGKVLPVAAELGISFDQVGAAIASMTRLGLDANEATTSLRGIMTTLLKPTTEANTALREVGLSAAGLRQQVRDEGLLATLFTLRERFEGNDEAITKVFGNVRALTGVLNLTGESAEAAEAIFANLAATTENDLAVAFAEAQQSAGEAFETMNTELNVALTQLGVAILPVVTPAVLGLAAAIGTAAGWFQALSPEMQSAVVIVGGLLAAIGPLLIAVGMMASGVAALIPLIAGAAAAVAGGAGLTVAFLAIIGPIGWAVLAIGAVTAAIVVLWTTNEDFRSFVTGVWEAISSTAVTVFGAIVSTITGAWESIASFTATKWAEITGIVSGALGAIEGVINLRFFGASIVPLWASAFVQMAADAWANMQASVDAVEEAVDEIDAAVTDTLAGRTATTWGVAVRDMYLAIQEQMAASVTVVEEAVDDIAAAVDDMLTDIGSVAEAAKAAAGGGAGGGGRTRDRGHQQRFGGGSAGRSVLAEETWNLFRNLPEISVRDPGHVKTRLAEMSHDQRQALLAVHAARPDLRADAGIARVGAHVRDVLGQSDEDAKMAEVLYWLSWQGRDTAVRRSQGLGGGDDLALALYRDIVGGARTIGYQSPARGAALGLEEAAWEARRQMGAQDIGWLQHSLADVIARVREDPTLFVGNDPIGRAIRGTGSAAAAAMAGSRGTTAPTAMTDQRGGDQTIILQIDGREIARVVLDLLTGQVRNLGALGAVTVR